MSQKNSPCINILVADDHSLIRQGILFLLEEIDLNCEIIQAANIHQILTVVNTHTIEIAILDAQFPEGNILNSLQEIKRIQPDLKILIFTGIDEDQYALKYIYAGANGFLSKMSEEEEIKNAILKIHHSGKYLSLATQSLLLNSIHNKDLINPLQSLSERELQVAEMYAEGLGNLEIANRLNLKQNTISTMKKRMFQKLKIKNLVQLVELLKNHQ